MHTGRVEEEVRTGPEALHRVLDPEVMLSAFRSGLPALTEAPIRVNRCRAELVHSRRAARGRQLRIVYRVGVEVGRLPEREVLLLGVAPVSPAFLTPELLASCAGFEGHPWVVPFRGLAAHFAELELGIRFLVVDPALPALAELTGSDARGILDEALRAPLGGRPVARVSCRLCRYKPSHRAVLRIDATLGGSEEEERTFFVKIFADGRGARNHREMDWLWSRERRHLGLPQPLHYDPPRRMLVQGLARGARHLTEWIRCLEKGRPLPIGVDLARVEHGVDEAARALAELQLSGLEPEISRTFRDELAPLAKDRDLLDPVADDPALRPLVVRLDGLLERLGSLAPTAELLQPSHGGLTHKELFGSEAGLTLIDWDGLCAASPALDAATFLQRLGQASLARPGGVPAVEHLVARFRATFLRLRPEVAATLPLYEGLVLAGRILRGFRCAKEERSLEATRRLLGSAEEALDRAQAGSVG